jgi:RNA polymerase sigma factor (sigma-70 family)
VRALPLLAGMLEPTRPAAGSDADLMRRFAAGEAVAFNALYQRYELRVFRYLLRNLRDRALAEDLLQDIWFSVAREASRYQPRSAFSAWLFRIAHNRMVDALRAARPEVSLELVTSGAVEGLLPSVAGPHAEAIASEELAAVLSALAQLPEEQCQAFLLQQEGELSIEDIAAVVGCPFETAKSRLRYARSRLRELLRGLQ